MTMSYVQGLAQYQRVEFPAGKSLRLGSGAELVILEPAYEGIATSGFDPQRTGLVNLSSGSRVGRAELAAYQHYVNGASGDLFIRFAGAVTVLIRGDWM